MIGEPAGRLRWSRLARVAGRGGQRRHRGKAVSPRLITTFQASSRSPLRRISSRGSFLCNCLSDGREHHAPFPEFPLIPCFPVDLLDPSIASLKELRLTTCFHARPLQTCCPERHHLTPVPVGRGRSGMPSGGGTRGFPSPAPSPPCATRFCRSCRAGRLALLKSRQPSRIPKDHGHDSTRH